MSADFTYYALVADRTDIRGVLLAARTLDEPTPNDGWSIGAKLFEGLEDHPYLFMIAPDRARCVNGAPLVHICPDESVFRACVLGQLSELQGRGGWLTIGRPETRALLHSIAQISVARGECVLTPATCRGLH